MAENAKWMDSIEGKSQQLTNAMQALWNDTINSNVIKFFLDVALGVTKVVDKIGLLSTALAGVFVYFTAFKKNNPLTLLKEGYTHIQGYQQALYKLHSLGKLNLGFGDSGSFNPAVVNAYAQAVSNLTAQKQAEVLATSGLNQVQIAEVMHRNGVNDAVIKETLSKTKLASTTQILHKTTVQEALASQLSSDAMKEQAVADFLAANGKKKLTAELLAQMVQQKILTQEQAANIASSYALAGANNALGASFKTVGLGIKAAFMSNPVGMILTIITSVASLISWLGSLKKSTEELSQAVDETISKYTEAQTTLRQQKATIDELSASYEKLSKGVDFNTNENISLTTESYQEYLDICNDIADMYPHLVTGFDAQGNAILSLKGNVEELIQTYREAAQTARQELIVKSNDIFESFSNNTTKEEFWTGFSKIEELEFFKQLVDGSLSKDTWDLMTGISTYANLLKNAGMEVSVFASAKDVKKQVKDNMSIIQAYYKKLNSTIESEAVNVRSLMHAYLGEDLDYVELSEKSKTFVNAIVSSLNTEFISKFDSSTELYSWIKTNIVNAFQDSSVVDAINSLSDLQLEFTTGDISYFDYKKRLAESISQIQNKVDQDALNQIKISVGVDEESLDVAINHIKTLLLGNDFTGPIAPNIQEKITSLSIEDVQIAGQLEVPEGILYSWEELLVKIEEAKIAATKDFDITNYTDAISSHSAAISEYQEALQKLGKGSFTMDDFMELIKKYPELAKGVDISSNAFHGLSRNLSGAIRTSTKNFVKDLKELRSSLVAAGKSTSSIDQLIEAIESMPDDALDNTIQKYSTLADKIDSARRAQDKLLASMEENPNEGYETRGEAMEYMKEAMKKGEIGSESNLWNVAEKYGFTYDSAKTINENADALAKFIATRERWFKTSDDGDDRTNDDGYSYEGTENFIKDVESAVKNNAELQKYLTWDYNESTGVFNFDYNNEDWDTIVSILSETKQLAGLTSDEFADLMIQVGQYFGIDWGNYDDVLSHLNKIATGTSDAKTKVEEYGKVMQDYFGKNTTIDLTARPMVKFDSTNFKEWEKLYQEIITNPDGHSEADVKNAKEQLASIQKGDSYATVYSSTFSNEDGTKSVVVTPILPDGKVLSPKELEEYANKLLAGEEVDPDVNIKLAEFDGSNSIQKAGEYAQALHEAQAEYDALRDTLKINTTIDEKGIAGLKEIKEIQDTIHSRADGTVVIDEDAFRESLEGAQYTEDQIDLIIEKIKKLNKEAFNIDPLKIDETLTDKGVAGLEKIEKIRDSLTKDESTGLTVLDTDMFTSVLQEAGYTKDQIDALIKKIQEYESIVSVSGNTDPLGLSNASLSADSLKASLSALGIIYKDTLGTWFDGKRDLTINVTDLVTTLKAKGWTDASIKEYITKLSNNTNLEGFNVKVTGIENIDEVIKTANEVPEEETTEYTVTGTGLSTAQAINDELSKIPATKSTSYTITETTIKKTKDKTKFNLFDPSTWANGTANVQGTAYKGGSWGAPRTETALTGELGTELIVRNGKWFTVGENGAEFTQIKKGDIIFNHKQTKQLLENGYVTSRGKAYASGTSYAEGGGTFARYEFSGSGGYKEYNVNNAVVESWGDLSGKIDKSTKSLKSAKDSADEFEETIDWIEIRLEEINEQLDLMNAKLENAVGYSNQNQIIDSMLSINNTKLANLQAGLKTYEDYANKLLKKVPSKYRKAAQDGSIAITEFAGKADEATVEAINNYREWAEKVADLTQQIEELETEIAELAKQKFDNVSDEYDNIVGLIENANEKLDAQVSLMEDRGYVASKNYYQAMIVNTQKQSAELIKERDALQSVLDEQVKLGNIKVGSDAWYEMVDQLYEVDAAIVECTSDIEEYQNAINDIYWDNFDELINRLDYLKDETQNLIDLMENSGDLISTPEGKKYEGGTKEYWTADDVEWTDEGITSLGLYAQQMEIAEYQARQYQEAIDDLNRDYALGKYSESEYLEKLNELKSAQYDSIEAYYDAQDAIVELNEARIDSIKEGIEREIEAYEELIEKKKEELDAEKDLHDFRESTMEQQKNIADIERKLAALSGDNSSSAIAQRKQLQAELAEAKYELEESYYDRSVDQKQEALDKELEDFQNEKDAEIEKWEEYLDNVEQVVADSLLTVQNNASTVYDTLNEKADEYNLTLSNAILTPWKDGALAVSDYQTTFDTAMSSTMDQLEAMKMKWQAVIDLMTIAAGIEIKNQKDQNDRYTQATYEEPKVESKPTTTPQKDTTKAITVGGKINAGSAKIYATSSGTGGGKQYYVNDPVYVVLAEQNGYVKVRHHSLKSGVSGWFKKSQVKAYAKGSKGVDKDQWALLDELGEELVLSAGANGKLQYITRGTSIIPHDISENLMKLGQLDPQEILDRNRPTITPNKSIINNSMEISVDASVGTLLHIEHLDGNNPDEVIKIVDKAWEKKMQGLNNSIKKFVR